MAMKDITMPLAPLSTNAFVPDEKTRKLWYGGFGILVAIAIYYPIQDRAEERLYGIIGGLPSGLAIINILLIIGVIGLFKFKNTDSYPDKPSTFLGVAMVGLTFFSLLGFFTAQMQGTSTSLSNDFINWKRWSSTFLLYVFVRSFIHSREQIKILLHVMTVILGFASFQLLRESFDGGMSASAYRDNLRFGGIFGANGVNDLGAFFAEFFFVPLCLLALETGLIKRLYVISVVILVATACMFTYSRGAWMALGAGLIVYCLRRHLLAATGLVLIVALLLPVLPASVVDRWRMTEDADGALEESAQSRVDLWHFGIHEVIDSPVLGVGTDRFRTLNDLRLEPHNMYLKIAAEQGVPACFCFALFLIASIWLTLGPVDRFEREVFLMFTGCWAALVVVNIFGNRFLREGLMSNYVMLCGVVVWMRTHRPDKGDVAVEGSSENIERL